jgi:hypothetical protein
VNAQVFETRLPAFLNFQIVVAAPGQYRQHRLDRG